MFVNICAFIFTILNTARRQVLLAGAREAGGCKPTSSYFPRNHRNIFAKALYLGHDVRQVF